MPKIYTTEQKKDFVQKFCTSVIETETPVVEICRKIGIDIGTIDNWGEKEPKFRQQKHTAMKTRAWMYARKARTVLEDAKDFFEDHKGNLRECNSPINKARNLSDFYMRMAAVCAPDTFGDLRHEIKEIKREILSLKRTIDQQRVGKPEDKK